ncbi:hypothetical protein FJTKL_01183 [Diaporthe vaccinii]|uniref:FAD-binding PCMH-type domain-containing protein n=1 Tax=Diaporthe vaccinii TaxID=105482 RepID=A0ABR4F5D5_9PEZI
MVILRRLSVLLWALLALGDATVSARPLTWQQIAEDLRSELSAASEVISPSEASYATDFTPRYNIAAPPTYTVAVKPALVKYALSNNVSLLATGGGHGYSTSLSRMLAGINLDLGNFKSIEVDPAAGTMTIGGAVRASEVATALQSAGMEITVPQCSCIGFAGATLGGGIGPYSGLHGPISDSLLSVNMVTGSGELMEVSQEQHQDLFYGVKGAGFNYGIATSLTYRIYPATNGGQTMNADMVFPGALNGSVWELVKSLAESQPKELSIGLGIRYSPDAGIIIAANFIYAGPQEKGTALIQPFLDLQPLDLNISTVAWKDIPAVASYGAILEVGCIPGVFYVPNTVNLYQIDVENLVRVVDYMNSTMAASATLGSGGSVVWQQYASYGFHLQNQASSAFPHRDAVAFVQVDGVGTSAADLPELEQFGRDVRDMLQSGSGRDKLHAFVHFAHGDESPAAWYSAEKLPRLAGLKRVHDPSNLFSWYNPV